MDALTKIQKARISLILTQPFFGTLALKMRLQEKDEDFFKSCNAPPTAAVDGRHMFYYPGFIDTLSLDECKGLICHEVMHLALMHHLRRGEREPRRWNHAGDYAINPLIKSTFKLPQGGLDNPAYYDKSAEEIYNLLPPNPPGGGGQGNEPGTGEVLDFPGDHGTKPSEAEINAEEAQTKMDIVNAAKAAKQQGKLPAGLDRLIQEITESKVNWKDALQRFITQQARNDYSFRRFNPRYSHTGFFLPSLYSEELPPIVFAVDTSGSMGQAELDQAAGELDAILTQYPTTIYVLYIDTEVNGEPQILTRDDQPLELKLRGGGGTDFRPAFDWITENMQNQGEQPCCLVYFTDMYGTFPDSAPDYPVLWITEQDIDAPFGETVKF